jgi:putative membrane protein
VGRLQAGLSNAGCDPLAPQDPANPCGLREGLSVLIAGMDKAVLGLQQLAPGGQDALSGANELAEKIDFAGKGAAQLADGLGLANSGSKRLAEGTGELVAGTGTLRAGLGQLDDGAGQLSDGAAEAADGSGQLATGADQLADGLKDAANGSGQLADGLGTAAGGAPKLVDGAQRLSDEGTKKLVEAGTATAQSYGEMYATMTAGAERANTEKMAFGAPEDAVGLTAYNYILKGDDGESGRNWARGLGGLAVLGAGAGVFALRRRFI